MSQTKTRSDKNTKPTSFIEALESRRLMSADALMMALPSNIQGTSSSAAMDISHTTRPQSELGASSSGSKLMAADGGVGAASVLLRRTPRTGNMFSSAVISRPASNPVIAVAMTEGDAEAAVSAVRSHAASQGNRALSMSSGYSFAGRPPRREEHRRVLNSKGKLLLVEDDPNTRRALTTILQKQGWDVSSAGTVAEGMRMMAAHPDRVIVDLMLPDGDGAQLLEQANVTHPHPRMMVTTGVSDPARLSHVRSLGADAILKKPVNLPELLKQLDN